MKVLRIVANIGAPDTTPAKRFYQDILGLNVIMDHGWITTFGATRQMSLQLSIASEGGSGTPVPDLSIEVDDLDAPSRPCRRQAFRSNTGRPTNLGASGVFTFAIRSASW
jgi:catechol 2,3-dioxygenase-like lactoylglutathione lyase family enzyme